MTALLLNPYRFSSAVVSDTFTRADSAVSLGSADTGQAWTAVVGTWGITSNKGYCATAGNSEKVATVEAALADCSIQVTMRASGDPVASGGGITFRRSDATNYLIAVIESNALRVYKRVAGAFTSLGFYSFTPLTTTDYVVKVTLVGSTIKAFLDGTERVSVSDSHNSTATLHGLRDFHDGPLWRFDNFTVSA